MDLEGKILGGRYEILKKIGVGGMATVYKAKCQILNRYVAIKILKEEFTTDIEFIKRFKTEAEAVASLSHPNIVSIYDVGQEGRIHYIVMELVEGKTLKDIIREDGKLSWKWSTNIAAQISSALEVAHRNKIIHRDIKPHNIIITEDGIAKVTDFGIAKAVSNSTITAFGTTIGSVHYFSPEHARGGFTDEKSDLYSVGVVLYELVTGRVPFDSDTPVSIALKHIQEEPMAPIKLEPSLPKSINDIILKAMQKEPSLRYSTATELLTDLQVALKHPELDFVTIGSSEQKDATQKIPKLDMDMINKRKEPKKQKEVKKSNVKEEKRGLKELFKKSKSFRTTVYIIGGVLLFAIIAAIVFLLIDILSPSDVEVPNLIGKSQTQAAEMLNGKSLNLEVTEEVFDEEIPAGFIIWQSPENPMKIKEGRTIQVKLSKGSQKVTVPDVTDSKYDEAIKELEALGLKVEQKKEYNKKIDKDYIIKQSPTADTEVDGGTTVTLYISKGEEIKQSTVPNLVGKTEDEAKKLISSNNLLLKSPIEYVEDETKADGVVVKQSINAGNVVDESTSIGITVNKLPDIISGTVIIDLTPYKQEKTTEDIVDENGNVIEQVVVEEKPVKVRLLVDNENVYEKEHKPSEGKINVKVEGTSEINIKLYINDVQKQDRTMNLNSTTKLEI